MFYEVVPAGKLNELTYSFDSSLLPGQIVLVPVGKRVLPGIVTKKVAQPNFKTKPIIKVLYSNPLPAHLLKVIDFISTYYLTEKGTVTSLLLPRGVEKTRRPTEHLFGFDAHKGAGGRNPFFEGPKTWASAPERPEKKRFGQDPLPDVALNHAQTYALEALQTPLEGTKLLHGVTGSGKTNIYLKMALNASKQQKSTILLVPEIALTSQLVQVFGEAFPGQIVLLHSKQTDSERHQIWEHLLQADTPKVIIGPRSALFAPLKNLGLIIVDEEHEPSYYQENPPRYSAIRTASAISKHLKIPLILGSATPNIEDYYLAKSKNSLVTIKEKAKTTAKKPKIHLIDLRSRDNFTKNRYFSTALLNSIKNNLENGRQTLIFHNRRGSSPLTICESCGAEILCPNCFLPLTLHADTYELKCHTCDYHQKVPTSCPKCDHLGIIHKGFGTKLLESELNSLFKTAKIRRFDADNKKSDSLYAVYDAVKSGDIDILIGTQTLAKGLDLPRLATVGVVQADAGLNLPDFAAEERVYELLTQVIGRVGRGHLEDTEVFIQTFQPDHPVITYATTENYEDFATYLLKKRAKSGFPPYKFIAKLEITMKTEQSAIKKIGSAGRTLKKIPTLSVSTPIPAFHEHTAKGYTWQLIIRAKSRKNLIDSIKKLDQNFKITLDPPSLL
ncbi:primosomal protein N' [Candidatus Saccharibacteria bacterium]|nr:primosomal protein N' [Candidatus Saccharibacteria bacterium]